MIINPKAGTENSLHTFTFTLFEDSMWILSIYPMVSKFNYRKQMYLHVFKLKSKN